MADDRSVNPTFRRFKAGDRPSASEWNRIAAAVEFLYRFFPADRRVTPTEVLRLDSAFGYDQVDNPGAPEQSATTLYYDDDLDEFLAGSPRDVRDYIVDSLRTVWDQDEIVAGNLHLQSGKYIPTTPRWVRNAITWPDAGSYPGVGANTYPIKFVRVEYDQVAGSQSPRIIYLDSQTQTVGTNNRDDYVLNLYDDIGCDGNMGYIPPYTLIGVWNNLGEKSPGMESESSGGREQCGRWYTHTCCAYATVQQSSGGLSTTDDLSVLSTSSPDESIGFTSTSTQSEGCDCGTGECIWVWDAATMSWDLLDTCTAACEPVKPCQCVNGPPPEAVGGFNGDTWVGACVDV